MGGLPGGGDLQAEPQVQVGVCAKVGGGTEAPGASTVTEPGEPKEPGDGVATGRVPEPSPASLAMAGEPP